MKFLQTCFRNLRSPRCYLIGSTGLLLSTLPLALPGLALDISLPFLLAGYSCQNCSRPEGPATSGGIRGICNARNSVPLTPLAPDAHVGRTIAAHPTFAWYLPDSEPYDIEFNLYAVEDNGEFRLIHQAPMTSSSRLMSYTLPTSQEGLQEGQRYLWQVLLICDPTLPSSAIDIEAFVDVVSPNVVSPNVDAPGASEAMEPGQLAELGLWYDALAQAIPESSDSAWLTLLDELAQLEMEAAETSASDRYEHLQLILQYEEQQMAEEGTDTQE